MKDPKCNHKRIRPRRQQPQSKLGNTGIYIPPQTLKTLLEIMYPDSKLTFVDLPEELRPEPQKKVNYKLIKDIEEYEKIHFGTRSDTNIGALPK